MSLKTVFNAALHIKSLPCTSIVLIHFVSNRHGFCDHNMVSKSLTYSVSIVYTPIIKLFLVDWLAMTRRHLVRQCSILSSVQ